ncbi:hypothetical protein QR78_22065 [Methylobacterium indicum]|uniref:Uncharacterized protein n=1 Tax=Methylobacterium indicum TaxID=1775910 RepID=A0ABR5HIR7_9HYPH|nr:hypothetical protein QR78_22065 [Methylobacterium indicum]KMO26605.1 hypothetical protein QR79_01480 [Methylobacterium indicum]
MRSSATQSVAIAPSRPPAASFWTCATAARSAAARGVILDLRDRGEIGDDAFFRLEEELEGTELSATPRDEVVP